MGMFDYVRVSGPEFVCSEGHDLSGEEFQTKDLGCTLGYATIRSGRMHFEPHLIERGRSAEDYQRFPRVISIGCTCSRCPGFVQANTGNPVGCDVDFEVDLVYDGTVLHARRVGMSTSEWMEWVVAQPWMAGAEGPMPYTEAREMRMRYPERYGRPLRVRPASKA